MNLNYFVLLLSIKFYIYILISQKSCSTKEKDNIKKKLREKDAGIGVCFLAAH